MDLTVAAPLALLYWLYLIGGSYSQQRFPHFAGIVYAGVAIEEQHQKSPQEHRNRGVTVKTEISGPLYVREVPSRSAGTSCDR